MSTSKMIVLKSSDGETFEVEEAVTLESQTIKYMIEDNCADTSIPLPNVTGKILAKVIEYCKCHVEAPKASEGDKSSDEYLKSFDADFVKVDQGTLFGLILAILCDNVGQAPVQKILRNGRSRRTITIFTVGTGGMVDQRIRESRDLPRPARWHRIAVHNQALGAYAVQQLAKNSSVYVEGEIETRVYNDSISGEVKSIPEICVRRDGLVKERMRIFGSMKQHYGLSPSLEHFTCVGDLLC